MTVGSERMQPRTALAREVKPAELTLLFTDLVGSTELLAQMGDGVGQEVLCAHFELLRDTVIAHGGEEVKSLGDGLMVAFADPERALACAANMQRRVDDHNARGRHRALGLRVGVNSGEAIREGRDYFGMTVVLAKRLCDRADAGQILLSDAARGDAELEFADAGALSLKGIADPVRAWELVWRPEARREPGLSVLDREASIRPVGRPEAPVPVDGLPAVLARLVGGRFVGRGDVLSRLATQFDRAHAGERRLVALAGEAGIGKTRLAAEAAARARARGATVLYGRCDEEPLMAYQPFAEALAECLSGWTDDEIHAAVGDDGDALGRLLPQLQPRMPSASRVGAAEADRYRLFEAVDRVLAGISSTSPVVVVLDDLHWADKPTLLLLRYLMRNAAAARLLVIVTYRESDVTARHPLTEITAELRSARVFERIHVGGLTEYEVDALVAAWAGQPAPPGLVARLCQETEGHPFFVEEVLRHLLDTGAIYERRGRLSAERAFTEVPESLRDVIDSRLARLDASVQEVLTVAAVLGREFRLDLLASLTGRPIDDLLTVLEQATAARVAQPAAGAYDRYVFCHGMVREVLYDRIIAPRRARLHAQLAEQLESSSASDADAHAADLAYHFFRAAGLPAAPGKAIAYSIQAGAAATEQLAYEEASGHYMRALEALAGKPGEERRRCDVLLALGETRWKSGELAQARAAFGEAATIADTLGLADEHAHAALGMGGRIGFRVDKMDPDLVAALERSLELLDESDTPLRAMAIAELAESQAATAPLEKREALCHEAEQMARRLDDPATLAFVLQRTIWALWRPDNVDWRLETAREVSALAQCLGDRTTVIEARLTQLAAQLEMGLAVDAMDASIAELTAIVREARLPYYEWLLLVVRALRALYDQPLEEAERLAKAALDVVPVTQHPAALEVYGAQIGYIRYLQGRMPELHASLSAYVDLHDTGAYRASLAVVYAEMGQEQDARRELEIVGADDFAAIRRDMLWFTSVNALTIVCARLRDQVHAQRLYELLQPHADRYCALGGMGVPSCSFQRHLGMLASTCARFDDAERHFATALGSNQRLGVSVSATLTKLEYGRMLVERDAPEDHERAHALLREAAAEAVQLGMPRIAEKARALETGTPHASLDSDPTPIGVARRALRVGGDAKAVLSTLGRTFVGMRVGEASDDALERMFGSPVAQRALMTGMAASYQPRMAFGFRGEIQIEFLHWGDAPRPSDWWTFDFRGKRATAQRRLAHDPAVTLHVDIPTFIRLFGGELNPIGAWLDGLLHVEGDVLLAPRLIELFGGVKPLEDLASADAA